METMRERFVAVSGELLDERKDIALVLADIGVSQFDARHARRIYNVGIREQLLIGFGAGLALEGFRPVMHSYAPFLVERPFEQLKLDFGHQGVGGVFVSVGASHDWASGGRTHHSPGDMALLRTLPKWRLQVPGHPDEVATLYRQAVDSTECVYLRLAEDTNTHAYPGGLNGLRVVRDAGPAAPTVVAVGPMLDRVLAATADMDVKVLYTTTPHPLDQAGLRSAVTGPDVVLVEPYLAGTSAAAFNEALQDRPHRLLAIGHPIDELRNYGERGDYDKALGLDTGGIRKRLAHFLTARAAA
ncbi:MAG: transketolase [Actinomycetota bacterium]